MFPNEKNRIPWIALSAALLLSVPSAQAQNSSASKTTNAPAKTAVPAIKTLATKPLTEQQKIVHALNRLAFGPRPGDVERVRKMGLQKWINAQLQPQTIPDSAVEEKLRVLSTLQMTQRQLANAYEVDQLFRREMTLMQQARNANQTPRLQPTANGDTMPAMAGEMSTAPALQSSRDQLNPQQQRKLQEARAMGLERGISVQTVGELVNAKIVRAVESERQLHEVLVDFWSNHFNLDVKKGPVRTYKIADEREVIRPHVWGNFRDLLGASAKSPAMLFYLDNVRSTKTVDMPNGAMRRNMRTPNRRQQMNPANATPLAIQQRQRGGLNENYARELMELHTLGVNGGYTQKDVQEVARCLTGWGVNRETGEFQFRRAAHDDGEKTVLGQKIAAGGGLEDGERVLDILANHPSTAKFIARKLCVRLVSDEPPTALIQKAADTFTKTRGDLRAVVESIVKSPEFFAASAARAKIKSPFEFAVSSVRALGGTIVLADGTQVRGRVQLVADGAASHNDGGGALRGMRNVKTLAREIATLGQPLYSFQAPTGYPENSQSWVSAGALVSRLNFALTLTGGQIVNVQASPGNLVDEVNLEEPDAVLNRLAQTLLGGEMSTSTRATLKAQIPAGAPVDIKKLTALILGSPEFQRR